MTHFFFLFLPPGDNANPLVKKNVNASRLSEHSPLRGKTARDQWWSAATAWADEAIACGEEPRTGGWTQHDGTPTRLRFLHAGRKKS